MVMKVTASETQTLFHQTVEQGRRLCIRNEVGQTDELAVLPRKARISIAVGGAARKANRIRHPTSQTAQRGRTSARADATRSATGAGQRSLSPRWPPQEHPQPFWQQLQPQGRAHGQRLLGKGS